VDLLEREIEEIKRLILYSPMRIVNNRWRMKRGEPTVAVV
jgi:hypothetical protein